MANRKNPPNPAKGCRALRRVAERSSLAEWSVDEPLTIAEAVALDVTAGALSEKGIRTAIENGTLPAKRLNGRFWITIAGVKAAFSSVALLPVPVIPETRDEDDLPPAMTLPTRNQCTMAMLEAERAAHARQ